MANTTLHFSLLSTTRIKAGFQLVFTGDGVGVEVRVDCSQPGGAGGYSHTLPIRVCAAQRGRDFEAPDLERGIHLRGVF